MDTQSSALRPHFASPIPFESRPAPTSAEIDATVYDRLGWHARGKGLCWPGDATLARDLGLSVAEVAESILRLSDRDAIGIEYRGQRRYLSLSGPAQSHTPAVCVSSSNSSSSSPSSFLGSSSDSFRLLIEAIERSGISEEAYYALVDGDEFARSLGLDPAAPLPFVPLAGEKIPADVWARLVPPEEQGPSVPQVKPIEVPAPLVQPPAEIAVSEPPGPPVSANVDSMAKLVAEGVAETRARSLARRHPERIERQLAALEFRNPKDRARCLVASIEEDWSIPTSTRPAPTSKPTAPAGPSPEQVERREGTSRDRDRAAWWARQTPEDQALIGAEAEARLIADGKTPDEPHRFTWRGLVACERWAIVESRMEVNHA